MSRRREATLALYDRKLAADAEWDLIYALGEMLGGPYLIGANDPADEEKWNAPCSPERSRLIKEVLALSKTTLVKSHD